MERLTAWLNQKIAEILEDLEERVPLGEPRPARARCRVFFMVSLVLGFSLLLVYTFIDAPDARVVQVYRLQKPGDKNHAFPSCFVYDNRSSPECKKWSTSKFPPRIPVSCPCTNTSAPWKDFVKFHVLHENSTDWNMLFTSVSSLDSNPEITVPDDTIPLANENIVKDPENLTAETFCDLSYLWPYAIYPTATTKEYVVKKVTNTIARTDCVWMATLLFPGSNPDYEDRTRSTQFLNTPSLLSGEGLNTLLAQLARDSVLSRRLALDMVVSLNAGNEGFRRFYDALARLLTGLLDGDAQMDPNQTYVDAANALSDTLSSNQVYDPNAIVWYLGDEPGPIFLQPEIDWEAYRQHCYPEYCEVIMPMQKARRLYWAFGILGGVATIALAVVTMLLWPCTAKLLEWISNRRNAATAG